LKLRLKAQHSSITPKCLFSILNLPQSSTSAETSTSVALIHPQPAFKPITASQLLPAQGSQFFFFFFSVAKFGGNRQKIPAANTRHNRKVLTLKEVTSKFRTNNTV
jgi:hypothetical protein